MFALTATSAFFASDGVTKLLNSSDSTVTTAPSARPGLRSVSVEIPLVQDKYIYIVIFLVILMLEWTMRRKMNLF